MTPRSGPEHGHAGEDGAADEEQVPGMGRRWDWVPGKGFLEQQGCFSSRVEAGLVSSLRSTCRRWGRLWGRGRRGRVHLFAISGLSPCACFLKQCLALDQRLNLFLTLFSQPLLFKNHRARSSGKHFLPSSLRTRGPPGGCPLKEAAEGSGCSQGKN